MADSDVSVLILNPIIEERANDFERFIRETIVPAIVEHRPAQVERWHVVRAREAQDGVITFGFLFDGGGTQDWLLEPVLEAALGTEGARAAMVELQGMFAGEQYGWDVTPVAVG